MRRNERGYDDSRVVRLAFVLFVAVTMACIAVLYLYMVHSTPDTPLRIAPPVKVKSTPELDGIQEDLRSLGLHDPRATAQAVQQDQEMKITAPEADSALELLEIPTIPVEELKEPTVPALASGQNLVNKLLEGTLRKSLPVQPVQEIAAARSAMRDGDLQQQTAATSPQDAVLTGARNNVRMQRLKQKILAGLEQSVLQQQKAAVSAVVSLTPEKATTTVAEEVSIPKPKAETLEAVEIIAATHGETAEVVLQEIVSEKKATIVAKDVAVPPVSEAEAQVDSSISTAEAESVHTDPLDTPQEAVVTEKVAVIPDPVTETSPSAPLIPHIAQRPESPQTVAKIVASSHVVQVSSMLDEAGTQRGTERFLDQFSGLMSGLTASVHRVNVADIGVYHQVYISGFGDKSKSQSWCAPPEKLWRRLFAEACA